MSNQEHEEGFVNSFILPEKQERYLSLLKTKKGRIKIRFGFNYQDINPKYATLINKDLQKVEVIEKMLQEQGAFKECYVISSFSGANESFMALNEALNMTVGKTCGTLISCIPGKLAYFEPEDTIGEKYLLIKSK